MRFLRATFTVIAVGSIGIETLEPVLAAESECKGLEKPACESNGSCSWVSAYKTKRGTEVSAFCRKKPERKQSSQAPATSSGS